MKAKTLPLLLIVAAGLFLTSCETSKAIIGPDGTVNQLIACNTIEQCYSKAREVCGGNYKIVNTTSESWGAEGQTDSTQKLLVKCDKL